MNIHYLGTAAFEGVPVLYCSCRVCRESLAAGGRALRTRSQALVDGELLLDFNADTVCHSLMYRIDWSRIGDCLITHSHSDHLYPADLEMLADPYSHEHRILHFYAARDGYNKIAEQIENISMQNRVAVTCIAPGQEFYTSGGTYRVLALPANHAPQASPVFYAIERGGKRMLYAHDTGLFPEEAYPMLEKFGRFDLLSLDCTGCLGLQGEWRDGHMSLRTCLQVIGRLQSIGVADEKTVKVVNHFSHNGGQTYSEMLPEAEKHGIIVAYDGLQIDF